MTLVDVVDLGRYPIDALDSDAGRGLVTDCQQQLAAQGVASLPGFFRPEALAKTVAVGEQVAEAAWHANQQHNVYFTDLDAATAEHGADDPRGRPIRSSQWATAYDLLPADLPLRTMYEADEMLRFLEAVLDKATLYRSVDPLDACEISYYGRGDELGWHFDNSEFSVTLMLREPESGGDFEYFPGIRSTDDERYGDVAAALDGDVEPQILPTAPGTLAIFQGRHALHRVSPVKGAVTRMNSVLTYGTEPDMCLSALTQELFYGRRVLPAPRG